MKDRRGAAGAQRGIVTASGPTDSPSWKSLTTCLKLGVPGLLLMVVVALIVTDVPGMLSVLFGSLLVIVFFGLSQLVAHVVGKRMPSALIGVFVLTFFVKLVGFAAVLYVLGAPDWLNRPWFAGAAVVSVLLWQAGEMLAFSRRRLLAFNDVEPPATPVIEDRTDGR